MRFLPLAAGPVVRIFFLCQNLFQYARGAIAPQQSDFSSRIAPELLANAASFPFTPVPMGCRGW